MVTKYLVFNNKSQTKLHAFKEKKEASDIDMTESLELSEGNLKITMNSMQRTVMAEREIIKINKCCKT